MWYKTLVLKRGTEFQEFYGYDQYLGWITCSSPIHMFNLNITWDTIKQEFPSHNYDDVELVTIKLEICDQ